MSQKLSIIDYNNKLSKKNKNGNNNIIIISKNSSNKSKNNESIMTLKRGEKTVQINLGNNRITLDNIQLKNKMLDLKKNITRLSKRQKFNEINKIAKERLNTTDRLKIEKEDVLIFQPQSYECEDEKYKNKIKQNKENYFININKTAKEDLDNELFFNNYKLVKKNKNKKDNEILKIKPKIKNLLINNEISNYISNSKSKRDEKNQDNKQKCNNSEIMIKIDNANDNNNNEDKKSIINNMNIEIKSINENEKTIEQNDNSIEDGKSNRTKAEAMDIVNILEEENMVNINSNFITNQSTFQTKQSKNNWEKNIIISHNNSSNNIITNTIPNNIKNEFISSTHEGTLSKNNEPISTLIKNKSNSLIPIDIITRKGNLNKFNNFQSQNLNILNQLELNRNKKKGLNNNANAINMRELHSVYSLCQLCGKKCPMVKLYSADCEKHLLCKKCFKTYYEDIIKKGEKKLVCPFIQCREPVNIYTIKSIINSEVFKYYRENNSTINNFRRHSFERAKPFGEFSSSGNINQSNLFSRRNILDINKNNYKTAFIDNKYSKDSICPFCYEKSIFSGGSGHFMKCLNCENAICKYCGKEYNEDHMEIYNENHCKIYYRKYIIPFQKSKSSIQIFFQLVYLFASFIIMIACPFFYINNFTKTIIKPKKEKFFIYFIKIFIVWLISILLYLIIFPIIFILLPYFPLIIIIFDIFNI